METLALNLKKFRLSKRLTQEQAAESLGVSAQTISRWETGITLPDVMKLPELARFYCVTVDDLFRDAAVAYENYAQRLASRYEAERTTANFVAAEQEFQALTNRGTYSMDDLRTFGIVYQYMMMDCREKALYWFDRAIREGAELHCRDYAAALNLASQGLERFPESWELNIHASDASRRLGRYQEAMAYADRALALHPELADGKFCKAWCYKAQGDNRRAAAMHREIAEDFRREGFEIEAQTQREIAAQLLQ